MPPTCPNRASATAAADRTDETLYPLGTDDAQEASEKLRADGHEFANPPAPFTQRNEKLEGVSFAYFRDSEGNLLEIFQDA